MLFDFLWKLSRHADELFLFIAPGKNLQWCAQPRHRLGFLIETICNAPGFADELGLAVATQISYARIKEASKVSGVES
jgi:hypothetical protein